jgi:hypothetical protein
MKELNKAKKDDKKPKTNKNNTIKTSTVANLKPKREDRNG